MTAEFLKVRSPEDIDFPTCSKHTAFSAGDVYATERTSLQTDSTHSISTKALHFLSFPSFPVGFFLEPLEPHGWKKPTTSDVAMPSVFVQHQRMRMYYWLLLVPSAAGKPRKLGPCMSQQGASARCWHEKARENLVAFPSLGNCMNVLKF